MFNRDNGGTFQAPPQPEKVQIPELRRFTVRRYHATEEGLEEVVVFAHKIELGGASRVLSFIEVYEVGDDVDARVVLSLNDWYDFTEERRQAPSVLVN